MTERKTFTIIMATDDNGNTVMSRRNDGFNAHELLGLVEFTRHEIIQQLAGQITPDIVRREVVKDKGDA